MYIYMGIPKPKLSDYRLYKALLLFPNFHVFLLRWVVKCLPSPLYDHFSFDRINLIAYNV